MQSITTARRDHRVSHPQWHDTRGAATQLSSHGIGDIDGCGGPDEMRLPIESCEIRYSEYLSSVAQSPGLLGSLGSWAGAPR